MAFGKSKAKAEGAPVTDLTDWRVKSALQFEHLTLALARFENSITSDPIPNPHDRPVATGIVHFESDSTRVLRADLTFVTELKTDRSIGIGGTYINIEGEPGAEYVVLSVEILDPRGKIAAQMQEAFHSASLSKARFLHVELRRPKLDQFSEVMVELAGGTGNAYHPVTQMFIRRQSILPDTPVWAWAWRPRTPAWARGWAWSKG
jgi:hypothetical protein